VEEKGQLKIQVFSSLPLISVFQDGKEIQKLKPKDGLVWLDLPAGNTSFFLALKGENGTLLDQYTIEPIPIPNLKSLDFKEIAVNVGSNCAYLQPKGKTVWLASQASQPGSFGTVGGLLFSSGNKRIGTTAYVQGTEDKPLFQTQQTGIQQFKADVPDGQYQVEIYLAELEPKKREANVLYDLGGAGKSASTTGNRKFHIQVNGQMWLENVEPETGSGGLSAISYKSTFDAKDETGLTLNFIPVVGEPVLNGIRIVRK